MEKIPQEIIDFSLFMKTIRRIYYALDNAKEDTYYLWQKSEDYAEKYEWVDDSIVSFFENYYAKVDFILNELKELLKEYEEYKTEIMKKYKVSKEKMYFLDI